MWAEVKKTRTLDDLKKLWRNDHRSCSLPVSTLWNISTEEQTQRPVRGKGEKCELLLPGMPMISQKMNFLKKFLMWDFFTSSKFYSSSAWVLSCHSATSVLEVPATFRCCSASTHLSQIIKSSAEPDCRLRR